MDEDHARALQVVLSDNPHSLKVTSIFDGTHRGCTYEEAERFMSRRRSVNELIAFMSSNDSRRHELPLNVRDHIRHLVRNSIITIAASSDVKGTIPIETRASAETRRRLPRELPSVLDYVLKRLDDTQTFPLSNGWVLESSERRHNISYSYRVHANEIDCSDSIWHGDQAMVVATMYAGMGHFQVLGFDAQHGVFFYIHGGGVQMVTTGKPISGMRQQCRLPTCKIGKSPGRRSSLHPPDDARFKKVCHRL